MAFVPNSTGAGGGTKLTPWNRASILQAYRDVGMRASYSYMLRDQNRLAYEADQEFVRRLPPDLAPDVGAFLTGQTIPIEDQLELFRSLWEAHRKNRGDQKKTHFGTLVRPTRDRSDRRSQELFLDPLKKPLL